MIQITREKLSQLHEALQDEFDDFSFSGIFVSRNKAIPSTAEIRIPEEDMKKAIDIAKTILTEEELNSLKDLNYADDIGAEYGCFAMDILLTAMCPIYETGQLAWDDNAGYEPDVDEESENEIKYTYGYHKTPWGRIAIERHYGSVSKFLETISTDKNLRENKYIKSFLNFRKI